MFFDQNDLYLTYKFKMVTASRQIKVFSMHVNSNIINNMCLMEIYKATYYGRLGCKAFETVFKYSTF